MAHHNIMTGLVLLTIPGHVTSMLWMGVTSMLWMGVAEAEQGAGDCRRWQQANGTQQSQYNRPAGQGAGVRGNWQRKKKKMMMSMCWS